MVRLLLEDVTLLKKDEVTAHVRFKGGISKTLTLPRPLTAWELRLTPVEVVAEIDRLIDHHTDSEIVRILNERGLASGWGKSFSPRIIARVRREYKLKPRYDRLREKGLLTIEEVSDCLKLTPRSVRIWRIRGLLCAYRVNDKDLWLYEHPGPNPPRKERGVRRRFPDNGPHGPKEVQYEA
jgi:hypothetical protein